MIRLATTILLSVFLASACSSTSIENHSPQPDKSRDALLVTVHTNDSEDLLGSPTRLHSYSAKYSRNTRARQSLRALGKDYNLTPKDMWNMESLGVLCQIFEVPSSTSEQVLNALKSDARVESVQLMNRFYTLVNTNTTNNTHTPILRNENKAEAGNYRALQHYLDLMDINSAHAVATGRNVTVAVIDTHIDAAHPNLSSSLLAQHNVLPDIESARADAHGTAVAGIIAARPLEDRGILGIAPDAKILALTACWPGKTGIGECSSFTLARALDMAIVNNTEIINLSLHGPRDALLARLVKQALSKNIAVVGAFSTDMEHAFPGSIQGVLTVAGATDRSDVFSLPDSDVLTTAPQNRYDFVSGNSMSAAQLSGIAALVLELSPDTTPSDLRTALNKSIDQQKTVNACLMIHTIDSTIECKKISATISSSDLLPTNH